MSAKKKETRFPYVGLFFLIIKSLGILPSFRDKLLLGLGSGKIRNTISSELQCLMNLFCED